VLPKHDPPAKQHDSIAQPSHASVAFRKYSNSDLGRADLRGTVSGHSAPDDLFCTQRLTQYHVCHTTALVAPQSKSKAKAKKLKDSGGKGCAAWCFKRLKHPLAELQPTHICHVIGMASARTVIRCLYG